MKTISKQEAVSLLTEWFDTQKLTFRSLDVLKEVFDEAVSLCNENRLEAEATSTYKDGRGYLPSKDTEMDGRDNIAFDIEQHLSKSGIGCSDKVKDSLVDLLIAQNDYTSEDFYLL